MAELFFSNSEESHELADGEPIAETCEQEGIPFACTEGVCGTCVIEVVEGMENLSPPTQEECDFLGDDTDRERLACQCRIQKGRVRITY